MTEKFSDLIEQRFGLPGTAAQDRAVRDDEAQLARILSRRTHRRYREEPVAEELLERLLACGLSASAKSDLQQASIVVLRDRAKQAEIGSWIPSMPWIESAPLFLVFCADHHRLRTMFEQRDRAFPNDNVDMFMNAAVDAALVMQTFTLAAESVGLGCCPISEIRTYIDELTALLGLPRHVFPIAGLCVGYPEREGFVSMRLPPSLTVHYDRYDDRAVSAKIDDYDRRRDARFRLPADRQREVERFGQAEFYGWSEDKARQYASPARPRFRQYLERQGFALE